jgi:iron complex transport system substrate-binding protein
LASIPLLIALAACGGGSATPASRAATPSATAVAAAAFPVTVTAANGDVTLKAAPEKIVSMSPTATEMLFAIGAGPQVKAVDDNSTYPADAPKTDLSAFTPNTEAVAGYSPDLVVIATDSGGLLAGLTALGIPVLQLPAATTLDDTYTQMQTLGDATGNRDGADKAVQELRDRLDAAFASAPASAKGLTVYHELDDTYYSVTSKTFIGSIYARFGLINIADKADATAGDYPQLSAEYVVKAAPNVVVLADSVCCGQNADTFAARPGMAAVPAVAQGRVIVVNDDIASRWGPRVADFAEAVAAGLGGGTS